MEEERQYHPLPIMDYDVSKSLRDIQPAHYTFKIESFSLLTKLLIDAGKQNYKSKVFEASGYKWRLSLYPNGDKERHGEGYISLYLIIEETEYLPPDWEVNVNFKFFVFDHIRDKYLTIQDIDGKVRRFHKMKTEWGFAKLLPLGAFKDAANGYLISDTCVFGVEVFVINYSGRGECVSILKELSNVYTWKIDNFSRDQRYYQSEIFDLEGHEWSLLLYPKGYPGKSNQELAIFLALEDSESQGNICAVYLLRARDQKYGQHRECSDTACFVPTMDAAGFTSFLSSTELQNASNGFLVNDTLIVEAEIIMISGVKDLSYNDRVSLQYADGNDNGNGNRERYTTWNMVRRE